MSKNEVRKKRMEKWGGGEKRFKEVGLIKSSNRGEEEGVK